MKHFAFVTCSRKRSKQMTLYDETFFTYWRSHVSWATVSSQRCPLEGGAILNQNPKSLIPLFNHLVSNQHPNIYADASFTSHNFSGDSSHNYRCEEQDRLYLRELSNGDGWISN